MSPRAVSARRRRRRGPPPVGPPRSSGGSRRRRTGSSRTPARAAPSSCSGWCRERTGAMQPTVGRRGPPASGAATDPGSAVPADGRALLRWHDRSMASSVSEPATIAPREAPASVARVVLAAAARHPAVALRIRDGDGLADTTFAELGAAATEIGAGLIELGIRPGDRVGIIGETRPEWTLADCGALCAGATVVPVYQTSSPEECRYVLEHAGVRLVICEDADAAREARADPLRPAGARARDHDGAGAGNARRSTTCGSAPAPHRPTPSSVRSPRSRRTTSRRSSTRPERPDRRRAVR